MESGISTNPLDRELEDGAFRRQESQFRRWVTEDGSTEFPLEAGRYHLYVARACPWAHRTIIARMLMGLEDSIGISYVDPIRNEEIGWRFSGGEYIDPVNGFEFLSAAYHATDPDYSARVTVPVLWDKRTGVIVSNESAGHPADARHRVRAAGRAPRRSVPGALRAEIETLNDVIYDNVNNAVYKAGFSTRQRVYEHAVGRPVRHAR